MIRKGGRPARPKRVLDGLGGLFRFLFSFHGPAAFAAGSAAATTTTQVILHLG
jgi:hypothetical protein